MMVRGGVVWCGVMGVFEWGDWRGNLTDYSEYGYMYLSVGMVQPMQQSTHGVYHGTHYEECKR